MQPSTIARPPTIPLEMYRGFPGEFRSFAGPCVLSQYGRTVAVLPEKTGAVMYLSGDGWQLQSVTEAA